VLVEKAKTTPENYPLSLNAVVNGCNQKSNRFPQMQLDADEAEEALTQLREMGAVVQIEGDGRVDKFRHLLYEWLGVDKVEMAVMAELLLRGAQTLGELRGRAARMERIADIGALRPVVDSLHRKQLLVYLTPPGRGCAVTHNLYEPQELAKLQAEFGGQVDSPATPVPTRSPAPAAPAPTGPTAAAASTSPPAVTAALAGSNQRSTEQLSIVQRELAELREEMAAELAALREELADLKRQLGA
jgi:uncharacterized protein YceH (UPF0502 family)